MSDPTTQPGRRNAALAFIYITVLLDMLAFGIVIPVLPHLIEQLAGGGIARAAWWVGIFSTVFALVQFAFSPVQGALSDRFGRRPVILISNLGLAVDFVILALAPTLWLLFVARVILGVTAASFTTANAYIADITPARSAPAPTASSAAPSAWASSSARAWAVSWAASTCACRSGWRPALALLNFLYGLLILPESLPPENRSARFEYHNAHPLGSLKLLRRYPQRAWPGGGDVPDLPGALRAADGLRAVRRLPLWLGSAGGGPGADAGRRQRRRRAGRS